MQPQKTHLHAMPVLSIHPDTNLPSQYLLYKNGEMMAGTNSIILILEELSSVVRKAKGQNVSIRIVIDGKVL
jgi:hypothetical protein